MALLDQIMIEKIFFFKASILFWSSCTISDTHHWCTELHILISTCYLLIFDNDHPHRYEIVPHGHLTWVFLMISEEGTIPTPKYTE